MHTHVRNAVPLVWGSLKLAPISSQISLEIDAVQMLSFQVSALSLWLKVQEGIQHGRMQVIHKNNHCHDCAITTLHIEVVYTSPFINTFICLRSKLQELLRSCQLPFLHRQRVTSSSTLLITDRWFVPVFVGVYHSLPAIENDIDFLTCLHTALMD